MEKDYIKPFPRVVRIEPASGCNLACSHCPIGTVKMARGIMSLETFDLILKMLKPVLDNVKVVVLYNGGEPFLNRNFLEMLDKVRRLKNDFFIKTVTNGMLLKEETLRGIIKYGLDFIEFSIDGESPLQSDTIREKSNFEVIKNNILTLIKCKTQMDSIKPEINISTVQFVDPGSYTPDQEAPVPYFLLEQFKRQLAQKEITRIKSTFAMRWPVMDVGPQYDLFFDPHSAESNYCDHVENTLTIRDNGDVVACCYDLTSAYRIGNIHNDDLNKIWNSERYVELRKSIHEKRFNKLCKNCNVVRPKVFLVPQKGFLP